MVSDTSEGLTESARPRKTSSSGSFAPLYAASPL